MFLPFLSQCSTRVATGAANYFFSGLFLFRGTLSPLDAQPLTARKKNVLQPDEQSHGLRGILLANFYHAIVHAKDSCYITIYSGRLFFFRAKNSRLAGLPTPISLDFQLLIVSLPCYYYYYACHPTMCTVVLKMTITGDHSRPGGSSG